MDFLDLLKSIRAEWATVTAHPEVFFATLVVGLICGWAAAWLLLHQRLALHKEWIERYKSMLNEGASSFGVRNRESRLGTLGTILVIGGLIALVVGIAFIFISWTRGNSGQLSLPLRAPSEQARHEPIVEAAREPPKAPIIQSAPAPVVEAPVLRRPTEPIAEAPIAPAPATTPAPPIPPKKPPKEFVDAHVTPKFLIGLYEGRTTLAAETLISKEVGKWMPVSGPLGEIHPGAIMFNGERTPTLVVFASREQLTVYMWFSGEWVDRLALLPKNQNISVVGQIKKVVYYNTTVQLENCELVDPDPTTNTPVQSPNSSPRSPRSQRRRRPSQG